MSRRARSWARSLGTAAVCWAVVWAGGHAADLHPHPGPLAVLAVAAAVVVPVLNHLASAVRHPDWSGHRVDVVVPRRGDPRFTRLHRLLVDAQVSGSAAVELRATLAALVDDRLRDHHGITREEHPDQATALLGPELDDLLRDRTPHTHDLSTPGPAQLTVLIDRIESL